MGLKFANKIAIQKGICKMKKCEFCEKFDFATARTEVTKYGANILLTLCNTKFDKEEQFNFCPVCGRNLKDEVSD